MPLLDLQLRLRQLGTLRMGELTTKNGKTYPTTRETWRVTTSDRKIADAVAAQFGGDVVEWDSKSAESLCVDTTEASLPIAVVPGHALSQFYELWAGGGCLRRCDGFDEMLSNGPCLCDPDSEKGRECKPTTRLSLVLRGIEALGLFRLNTGGWYAASELGGAVQFLERRTAAGEACEGWLRIEQRRVVRNGQTQVFKVPVLDVAYSIERMLPVGGGTSEPAPLGHTPIRALPSGPSLEQGLAAVESPAPRERNGRSAAPIPAQSDLEFGTEPVSVPVESVGGPRGDIDKAPLHGRSSEEATDASATASSSPTDKSKPTKAQLSKLGALVRQVRDEARVVSTDQMWVALASARNLQVDTMIEVLEGRDGEGLLHFGPLLDSLNRPEAARLITWLEKHAEKASAA